MNILPVLMVFGFILVIQIIMYILNQKKRHQKNLHKVEELDGQLTEQEEDIEDLSSNLK
jgi:hypothetical protein